jgi:hypothetical protein
MTTSPKATPARRTRGPGPIEGGVRKARWTGEGASSTKPGRFHRPNAQVAQLVEQRTENPRVGGSIPSLGTTSPEGTGRAMQRVCIRQQVNARISL